MGIFDRSSSTTNTTLVDQTNTLTEQTDQSGNQGFNLSGIGGGVSLGLSESNTLVDDRDIFDSRSSSSSVSTSIADSGNTYTTAIDAGAVAGGLALGRDALTAVQRANADSLTLLGGLVDKSIDASKTLARDSAESTQGFLNQAVSGFGALAKASSEGDADKITRVVGFALLAVAVVVIGPALLRGKGSAIV